MFFKVEIDGVECYLADLLLEMGSDNTSEPNFTVDVLGTKFTFCPEDAYQFRMDYTNEQYLLACEQLSDKDVIGSLRRFCNETNAGFVVPTGSIFENQED